MKSTKFTIAVATHNRREVALLAVRSALAQTRPAEQVIVLCDGCSDGTQDAIQELGDARVQLVELPKLPGFAYAHRNRALAMARGEVITWLGDDDLLLPDHLERIGEYWDSGTVELVAAAAVAVAPDDAVAWCGLDWSVSRNRELMKADNTNVMSSISVAVELARAVGGWDGTQVRKGDWDLWKRLLDAGARPAMTSEPTVLHFKATGREQAWADRVRQNAAWFERLSAQEPRRELRRTLRRARSEHEAMVVEYLTQAGQYYATLEAQVNELRTDNEELARQLAARPAQVTIAGERSPGLGEAARRLASRGRRASVAIRKFVRRLGSGWA